jgi:hypothetical protein
VILQSAIPERINASSKGVSTVTAIIGLAHLLDNCGLAGQRNRKFVKVAVKLREHTIIKRTVLSYVAKKVKHYKM